MVATDSLLRQSLARLRDLASRIEFCDVYWAPKLRLRPEAAETDRPELTVERQHPQG